MKRECIINHFKLKQKYAIETCLYSSINASKSKTKLKTIKLQWLKILNVHEILVIRRNIKLMHGRRRFKPIYTHYF